MPQFVTNTMRVCTRDAADAQYDASVPAMPRYYDSTSSTYQTASSNPEHVWDGSEEYCSDSPYDVPWSMEDPARAENPAAMFSTGCVPMWDGSPLASNPVYPSLAYTAQLENMDPGNRICYRPFSGLWQKN